MIDNVRLYVNPKDRFENHITSNNVIDLEAFVDTCTGELKEYPKRGKERNLDIKITQSSASICGSLHKYENLCFKEENQNHNDFCFKQMKYLIPHLLELFDMEGKTCLTNLEMGFNIKLDNNPQKLIDNNILMYDLKNHNKDMKFSGKGDYKEFQKTDYSLKIYNKSKQYKLNDNILRIEIKITKKRLLQKLEVYSIEDLLKKDVLFRVFSLLCHEFEKVLIIDNFDSFEIPLKDLEKLNKYTNPNYWTRIRDDKSYKVRNRLKKDFDLLINRYNLSTTKKELQEKLLLKFWFLINLNDQELTTERIA